MNMTTLTDKYNVDGGKFLGAGSFGGVVTINRKSDNQNFALKKYQFVFDRNVKTDLLKVKLRSYVMELVILRNTEGIDNVMSVEDAYVLNESAGKIDLGIVMPLYKVSLESIIYRPNNGLDYETIKFFSGQLLSALSAISNLEIIHRDIKPANIMIAGDNKLKLIDFGEACSSTREAMVEGSGTLFYKAPEFYMESEIYDERVDMWATACTIIEMFKGEPAFYEPTKEGMYRLFKKLTPDNARRVTLDDSQNPGDLFKNNFSEFKKSKVAYDPGFTPLHLISNKERRTEVEGMAGQELEALNTLLGKMLVFDFTNRVVISDIFSTPELAWANKYAATKALTKRDERIGTYVEQVNEEIDRLGPRTTKKALSEILLKKFKEEHRLSDQPDDNDPVEDDEDDLD